MLSSQRKKSFGKRKAEGLIRAVEVSIEVKVGLEGARIRLNNLLKEYEHIIIN